MPDFLGGYGVSGHRQEKRRGKPVTQRQAAVLHDMIV